MYPRGFRDDDSMCYCEYCGQHYYPEVGPHGHLCSAKMERFAEERRQEEQRDRKLRSRKKRKVRIIVEIECLDDDICEQLAIDQALIESKIYKKNQTC